MRVAVDEAGQRRPASSVHAFELGAWRDLTKDLIRRADRDDAVSRDGYGGGGVDAEFSELPAAKWSCPDWRHGGLQVVDQERDLSHSRCLLIPGAVRPPDSPRSRLCSPTSLYSKEVWNYGPT